MTRFHALQFTLLLTGSMVANSTMAAVEHSCLAQPVTSIPNLSDDLVIDAGHASWNMHSEQLQMGGGVQLQQNSQHISANNVSYDRRGGRIDATGDVIIRQPGYSFSTQEITYFVDEKRVESNTPVSYRLIETGGNGTAGTSNITIDGISSFSDISYSSCPMEDPAWRLEASKMKIDREKGVLTAHNVHLKAGDTTLLYVPYFQFPVDGKRHTGLLLPSIRVTSSTGTELMAPYYLNLAPNYDATIYPRITTKRGLILGGEFRYLTEQRQGIFEAEIAPWDDDNEGDELRYMWRWRNQAQFSPHLSAEIDYTHVSDSEYLDDMQTDLDSSSNSYRERFATLSYRDSYWDASIKFADFDPTDMDAAQAYERLPEILFNWRKFHQNGFFTEADASYVRFENRDPDKAIGNRVDLQPAAGIDLLRPWGSFKAKLSGRYTSYSLDRTGTTPGVDKDTTRTSITATLDGSLVYERDTNWFGISSLQTLEPRLFYTYTPYTNQDNLPVFDSRLADFSFENLFRENRFTGSDRVGDANQMVAAITTRFISHDSGFEWLRASLGQIIYFDEHEVNLPDSQGIITDETAFVASLYSQINDLWSVDTALQWSKESTNHRNSFIGVNYHDTDAGRYASLAWRERNQVSAEKEEELNYLSAATGWRVSSNLNVVGNLLYSLEEDRLLDVAAGVEYDSCCWAVRGLVTRRADDETDEHRYDTGFSLQFLLKGLGEFGTGGLGKRISPPVSAHDQFETYY
ncbi:LPS-assembly protein LptD [Solemya velum gill symbiont]|uniref:LPS-assembly protein LptD n=1 Tax=Solemya velum gill symbiont TaxID=2340 RepID=UPI00118196A2|nr:LPS assembly protein LptD [Solemya velum gill symbiont]